MAAQEKSSSVLTSSDVIYDFACEPCSAEKLNAEAERYCEQCQEYLCTTCCNYHRRLTASKHHKVLDTAAMPRMKSTPMVRDVLTELCPKHNDKILEYFCNKHDQLCCSVCINMDHKSCKKKSYIPDISDGFVSSNEYKELVTQCARVVVMATNEQMRVDVNDNDNDAILAKAISDIKACRVEVDKMLDTVVEEAIQDVTRLHKENSDKMKSSRQKCQSVLSDINAKTMTLEKKAKASKNSQLFVDMKMMRHRISAIEKDMKNAMDRKFPHFMFDKNEKVKELKSILSAVFTLSVNKEGAEANARFLKKVNVKSVDDKMDCLINGIVVMAADRLVVTDNFNRTVKLVDVRQNSVISRLPLSSGPFDVVKTAPSTVAVSLGDVRKIEILVVSDVLARSYTINVSEERFTAFCHIGDTFILVCSQTRAVKIVDMSGRVLRTIFQDKDTDSLFKKPRYIAVSRTKDVLYITDRNAKVIAIMTLKGHVISAIRYTKPKYPQGIGIGREGEVFVCSSDNHTVHQLSAMGQHVKLLLDERRGLAIGPNAIAYDEDDRRLCISSDNAQPEDRNNVILFQLE